MSHSSCLVAIDPIELKLADNSVETAVAWQMEPFSEEGEWFKDGSRWDWYVIGGRFTGRLDGYDPDGDPRNWEVCNLCGGSGKREDMIVANGCNKCLGTGTARKWSNSPHEGDVQVKRDIDLLKVQEERIKSCRKTYLAATKISDVRTRQFVYGIEPDEEIDSYIARVCGVEPTRSITHGAFLRNRHWHDPERAGWFGGTTATECERNSVSDDIEAMIRRCKYKDEKSGACCVTWNEPYEIWAEHFWKRFVEPLAPETYLVTVDYHV